MVTSAPRLAPALSASRDRSARAAPALDSEPLSGRTSAHKRRGKPRRPQCGAVCQWNLVDWIAVGRADPPWPSCRGHGACHVYTCKEATALPLTANSERGGRCPVSSLSRPRWPPFGTRAAAPASGGAARTAAGPRRHWLRARAPGPGFGDAELLLTLGCGVLFSGAQGPRPACCSPAGGEQHLANFLAHRQGTPSTRLGDGNPSRESPRHALRPNGHQFNVAGC